MYWELPSLCRRLPGGGKGVWRHIKASYGSGSHLISWVDGMDLSPPSHWPIIQFQPQNTVIEDLFGVD